MKNRLTHIKLGLFAAACLFASCTEHTGKSRGPIVLGDPATIVTETDSQYLLDMVPDVQPEEHSATPAQQPAPAKVDTPQIPEKPVRKDTAVQKPAPAAPAKTVAGMNATFKEVTVSIPGITTRSYNKGNLQNANGASYELTGGSLNGNQLLVSGGKVSRVQQRYQTVIIVRNNGKTLPLNSLSTYSSSWQQLKGSTSFPISGLDDRKLGYTNANPSAIRNAVQKAARSQRMSRKEEQQWISAVRNVRSANQSPCSVKLRSVIWRIEGSGNDGKKFNKEVRVDLPL